MKIVAFTSICVAFAMSARADMASTNAPFALPSGAKVVARDDSGRTWRQSGVLQASVPATRQAFSNTVARGGFVCRHVIPMGGKNGNVLEVWKRSDLQLMLMFWPVEGGKTMFSWGTFRE